jgi:1-acyl-sn-glycerol-3-phosphate acyltransferase
MPVYILLTRFSPKALRSVLDEPKLLNGIRETLESFEAKVIADFRILGEYDHCTIFDVTDNFRAYRACLEQEYGLIDETRILPAMDLPLFARLISSEGGTVGPHEWQVQWWAKVLRFAFRWHGYSRWVWQACKPLHVSGREHFSGIDGPCIVVGNHTSHLDALVLRHALPQRIKWNVYSGAAADRWFIKGRKELVMQPWYQSLVMATFPIQRGGGSRAIDYPKWLIDRGGSILIFPEGTRSTSRKLAKFRHGASILAIEKGLPVVPCYLYGLNKLRPKGQRDVSPGPAWAHFLPPLRFAPDTPIPDATIAIYHALNGIHERVMAEGPEALTSA